MLSEISRKKYSEASKRRQAGISPEIRRERMVNAAKARWANKTIEEKREHSLKMLHAKK